MMEGDLIVFVCGSCIPSMTVPIYIWRKDGHLRSQLYGDNILVLDSVQLEDSGRYSCTISSHEGLRSTSAEITVRPGCKLAQSFILKHLTCLQNEMTGLSAGTKM